MCRVAHQDNRYRTPVGQGLVMHPGVAYDARKADPDSRAAKMLGVDDKGVAVNPGCEPFFGVDNAFYLAHGVHARRLPCFVKRLNDECRYAVFELVGVSLEPAMFGVD